MTDLTNPLEANDTEDIVAELAHWCVDLDFVFFTYGPTMVEQLRWCGRAITELDRRDPDWYDVHAGAFLTAVLENRAKWDLDPA